MLFRSIEQAQKEPNTKLICGGLPSKDSPLSQGYFIEPTIFTAKDNSTILAQVEIFGPVVVCIPWENEEEVIKLANDTTYGLAGYVWCKNGAHGMKVAREIKAGWLVVNGGYGQTQGQPYGGMKESGLGREHSLEGMLESYTDIKSVIVNMD